MSYPKHHGDIVYIKATKSYYLLTWNGEEYVAHGIISYKPSLNKFLSDVVSRLLREGKWICVANISETFTDALNESLTTG